MAASNELLLCGTDSQEDAYPTTILGCSRLGFTVIFSTYSHKLRHLPHDFSDSTLNASWDFYRVKISKRKLILKLLGKDGGIISRSFLSGLGIQGCLSHRLADFEIWELLSTLLLREEKDPCLSEFAEKRT